MGHAPVPRPVVGVEQLRPAPVADLDRRYVYSLDEEPAEVRARFAPDVTEIVAEHDTAYEALRLGWAA